MTLIECVPNFSEGRRPEVVDAIRSAIAAAPGVFVLDVSSDLSHHRSVVTFVGSPDAVLEGAFLGIRAARDLIDLRRHEGVHPRIGAADVVPFVPLQGATMAQCIVLARTLGERVARDLDIPVYLYEHAATRADRTSLAAIRRGGFERLRDEIATDPARAPDFGEPRLHPSAGAVAIGARGLLIAYNVYLGPERNIGVAREVARSIRESSGGMPALRALALVVDGHAQVSMNLVNPSRTSLHAAYEAVRVTAAAHGVEPAWSEIVGLVPEESLIGAAVHHLRLDRFDSAQILEWRIRDTGAGGADVPTGPPLRDTREATREESVAGVLEALGAPRPTPGGGYAAALAGSLGAALVRMVAGITAARPAHADSEPGMREIAARAASITDRLSDLARLDAEAFTRVAAAARLPRSPDTAAIARRTALDAALLVATEVPLETARAAAEAAGLAMELARHGFRRAAPDAAVGALLAEAACRAAVLNIEVNVAALSRPERAAAIVEEAESLASRAAADRAAALTSVSSGSADHQA